MTDNQLSISQFYDSNSFAGYSVLKTRISGLIRDRYPDLKGEMNRILAENGGYIKISNIYENSIEFKYNKKFDSSKHNITDIFNEVFRILLSFDNMSKALSDSVFAAYSFQPQFSVNRELSFVTI